MGITVKDLAELALDEDATCRIWGAGTVFESSFSEIAECGYADDVVVSIEADNDVLVINI